MKILAIEFSSPQRSVAILATREGRECACCEVVDRSVPGTAALSLVEEALRQSQIQREQIQRVVVGLGPGSYTGIRGAIALAQGWQLARPVSLLGISSAECIAAQAHAEGVRGSLAVVIDAQRGEFYLATYRLSDTGVKELQALQLATKEQVSQAQAAGCLLAGPEIGKWFAAGRTVFPRAAGLGQLALTRSQVVAGEKLEPIYLRQTTFVKAPPPRVLPT